MVETSEPTKELKPAFDIIGNFLEAFITISDLYEPIDKDFKKNVRILYLKWKVFVTSSFDSLSHFEQDTDSVIEMYQKISGKTLDLTVNDN